MPATPHRFSCPDGETLHVVVDQAIGTPRAFVMIAHGYGEHGGRYQHLAERLNRDGFVTVRVDHYGYGASTGERAYCDRFSRYVDDFERAFDHFRADHPTLPAFVIGHSMGALIALLFTLRRQADLAGLVTSGAPVLADANVSRPLVILSEALNRVVPHFAPLKMLGADPLSTDPEIQAARIADALSYKGNLKIRTGIEMNHAARDIRAGMDTLTLPMLIAHGGADLLINPEGSRLLHAHVQSADKTLTIYDGLHHEIMHERDRARVLDDITMWLLAHV